MKTFATPALSVFFAAGIAIADTPPPANALPLSQIITQIEADHDVWFFDEIEWDDDGYWEVEYIRADGAKVSMKLDPLTGTHR